MALTVQSASSRPWVRSEAARRACHWARAQPLFCKLIPLYRSLHWRSQACMPSQPRAQGSVGSLHSWMVLSPCCVNSQQVQYFPSLAVCRTVIPLPPKELRATSTYSRGT